MLDLDSLDLIDKDITNNLVKVFKSKVYINLLSDLKRSLYQHKSVFLMGINDFGRLAIQVEASFRKFWLGLINIIPERMNEFLANYNYVNSMPIGGDLTIINTEIDFKDLYMIGNRQVEKEIEDGDICIVYGNDGTSRAINQAAITASKRGASVYYLYNIPKDNLANIDIAKGIISNKNIIKVCLATEDTKSHLLKELIFTYSAFEIVNSEWLKENLIDNEYQVISNKGYNALSINDYAKCFDLITKSIQKEKVITSLNKFKAVIEASNIYLSHNYLVDLLSVLVDNGVGKCYPPFKKKMENGLDPKQLIFDPIYPTTVAWQHIFRRTVKGLDESKNTYKLLGLNNSKISNYHSSELYEFMIGNEDNDSRYKYNLVFIDINENYEDEELLYLNKQANKYLSSLVVRIGNVSRNKLFNNELIIPIKLPYTVLDLFSHLIVRILFSE